MLVMDHDVMKNSVGKISKLDSKVMLPGHGKILTDHASKLITDYYNTL